MYVHASPLVEQFYVFGPGCSYDRRDQPLCVLDVTYTHEGERAYVSGLRGTFNRESFRKIVKKIATRGVVTVEYEHGGTRRRVELV